jgi:hypothetical protein
MGASGERVAGDSRDWLSRAVAREIAAFLDDARVPPRPLSHPAFIVPIEDEFRVLRGARSGSRR